MVTYLAQESAPGFSLSPRSSNSGSSAPSYTPEAGCSVPGSEQKEKDPRGVHCPTPISQLHTWTRWAGPRAEPLRPIS